MLFVTVLFMVWFLPLFLSAYHLIDQKRKNGLILLGSIFFYSWGGPLFIFLILLTTALDFYLVRWMDRETNQRNRRLKLMLPIVLNLGLLAYFKYANFFMANVKWMAESLGIGQVVWIEIGLPLGISFFTFESLTYSVDVYRKVHPALNRFWDYQLYILFFPKLLVGPIVRYHEFGPQIHNRIETSEGRMAGFYRMVTGFAKKLLIAEGLSIWVQHVAEQDPATLPATWALIGIIAFSLSVYYDFSGYSDIALGLAQMMGFRLPENFNNPFIARSITELWSRWHISLSTFMRHYLYIPLGGNRGGYYRTLVNLGIVFILSGLWHGASWACVIWGALFGAVVILERIFLQKWLEKIPAILAMAYTFLVFSAINVLFWSDSNVHATSLLKALTRFDHRPFPVEFSNEFLVVLLFAFIFAYWAAIPQLKKLQDAWFAMQRSPKGHLAMSFVCLALFFVCLSYAAWTPIHPFMYFRF